MQSSLQDIICIPTARNLGSRQIHHFQGLALVGKSIGDPFSKLLYVSAIGRSVSDPIIDARVGAMGECLPYFLRSYCAHCS